MQIQPYLFFDGRCEEALEFYRSKLGAEVTMLMRYKDSPGPAMCPLPDNWDDKIMHASFVIGASRVMGSDGMKEAMPADGHCMSLTMPTEPEARRVFAALADGGEVCMPIGKTFWSSCFGMVKDRFGIDWMITVPEQH